MNVIERTQPPYSAIWRPEDSPPTLVIKREGVELVAIPTGRWMVEITFQRIAGLLQLGLTIPGAAPRYRFLELDLEHGTYLELDPRGEPIGSTGHLSELKL